MTWVVGAIAALLLAGGIREIFKRLQPPRFRKHIDTYYNDEEDETKP